MAAHAAAREARSVGIGVAVLDKLNRISRANNQNRAFRPFLVLAMSGSFAAAGPRAAAAMVQAPNVELLLHVFCKAAPAALLPAARMMFGCDKAGCCAIVAMVKIVLAKVELVAMLAGSTPNPASVAWVRLVMDRLVCVSRA